MREILNFPQTERRKLEAVKLLIDRIAENLNEDCSKESDELRHITGKEHTAMVSIRKRGSDYHCRTGV